MTKSKSDFLKKTLHITHLRLKDLHDLLAHDDLNDLERHLQTIRITFLNLNVHLTMTVMTEDLYPLVKNILAELERVYDVGHQTLLLEKTRLHDLMKSKKAIPRYKSQTEPVTSRMNHTI